MNRTRPSPAVRRRLASLLAAVWLLASCAAGGSSAAGADRAPRAAAGAAAASPSEPPPLETVHFVYGAPSEAFALPSIGKAFGIFARHGIDLDAQLVTGTPRLVQSLVAGDFQFGQAGVTALMNARLAGADVVIVAALDDYSNQALLVGPDSPVARLDDLRGRTIGVSQYGSESDEFLRLVLASHSTLRADQDVTIVQTGGHPQTAAGLAVGQLDAGSVAGANRMVAFRAGAREITNARQLQVLAPTGTLATTDHLVAERPDLVRRFLQALVETIARYKQEPDRAADVLVPFMGGLDRPTVEALYQEHAPTVLRLPAPSSQGIQAVLERIDDPRARAVGPDGFVNRSFLQELEQTGFVATLYP